MPSVFHSFKVILLAFTMIGCWGSAHAATRHDWMYLGPCGEQEHLFGDSAGGVHKRTTQSAHPPQEFGDRVAFAEHFDKEVRGSEWHLEVRYSRNQLNAPDYKGPPMPHCCRCAEEVFSFLPPILQSSANRLHFLVFDIDDCLIHTEGDTVTVTPLGVQLNAWAGSALHAFENDCTQNQEYILLFLTARDMYHSSMLEETSDILRTCLSDLWALSVNGRNLGLKLEDRPVSGTVQHSNACLEDEILGRFTKSGPLVLMGNGTSKYSKPTVLSRIIAEFRGKFSKKFGKNISVNKNVLETTKLALFFVDDQWPNALWMAERFSGKAQKYIESMCAVLYGYSVERLALEALDAKQ